MTLSLPLGTTGAELSKDEVYRFRLWRIWNTDLERLVWIMLNPSDADASDDDPTVRKCIGFARRLGFGGIEIVNLYAFRTPSPKVLHDAIKRHGEAYTIGPKNDDYLRMACAKAPFVMAAWGARPFLVERAKRVRGLLDEHPNVNCLGYAQNGEPRHPLMLAYRTEVEPLEKPGPAR